MPASDRPSPSAAFYAQDVLQVAPALVGRVLVRTLPDGTEHRLVITETEAYRGEADTACHAHRGRTKRTEPLYMKGGTLYVYLCYGIHWLLNIVTGPEDCPQAVLLRACEGAPGPGRLTRALAVDGAFNRADITACPGLRVEDGDGAVRIVTDTRVGIDYADRADRDRLWRFKRG